MQKKLIEYKGVILFFIVLVIMGNICSNHVKKINAYDNNSIVYYEK